MKHLLLITILDSCQPSYATQTEALVFTDADVLQPSGGFSQQYGISQRTISMIVHKERWSHV